MAVSRYGPIFHLDLNQVFSRILVRGRIIASTSIACLDGSHDARSPTEMAAGSAGIATMVAEQKTQRFAMAQFRERPVEEDIAARIGIAEIACRIG